MSDCGTVTSGTPHEDFLGSVIGPLPLDVIAGRIQVSAIPVDLLARKGLRL